MSTFRKLSPFFLLLLFAGNSVAQPPTLTVVVVVDQWAFWQLQKVRKYFTGGIKLMLEQGIVYEEAHFPYSATETAVGHATFNTSALPKDHGIIGNVWYDEQGKLVNSDDDPDAAVLNAHYQIGKSAKNILVDGVSDQFVMASEPAQTHAAVAVSFKSRAAIGLANKMGKAIWFDDNTGYFTSSKAYFDQLPEWVATFNTRKELNQKTFFWRLRYPKDNPAYNFYDINNLIGTGGFGLPPHPPSLVNRELNKCEPQVSRPDVPSDHGPCDMFARSPEGNKMLFELAKTAINEYLDNQKIHKLLLWISCSGLDKVGHPYGPNSIEYNDTVYHVDQQLQNFMQFAQEKVGAKNVLFVLTSDHGMLPIPEQLHTTYKPAHRIIADDLVYKMNTLVEETYGIAPLVFGFKANQFFIDMNELANCDKQMRDAVITDLKNFLQKQPGIRKVWTFDELENACATSVCGDITKYYKNSLFKGRSGYLICLPEPYVLLSEHRYGSGHVSPYEYDTHVPLMIYQEGILKPRIIRTPVWMTQLGASLSYLLDVPRPSAATASILPGI